MRSRDPNLPPSDPDPEDPYSNPSDPNDPQLNPPGPDPTKPGGDVWPQPDLDNPPLGQPAQ